MIITMENQKYKSQIDIEWENRTLCSDESCIGVIGPDGRCKECGLSFENGQQKDVHEAQDLDEEPMESESDSGQASELQADIDIEWAQRKLCSDESCIGVIGPDGCCKECGKPFEGE